jgi:hypothetical protein
VLPLAMPNINLSNKVVLPTNWHSKKARSNVREISHHSLLLDINDESNYDK